MTQISSPLNLSHLILTTIILEYFIDENKRVIGKLEEEMNNYCLIGYTVSILKTRVLEIEWPIM